MSRSDHPTTSPRWLQEDFWTILQHSTRVRWILAAPRPRRSHTKPDTIFQPPQHKIPPPDASIYCEPKTQNPHHTRADDFHWDFPHPILGQNLLHQKPPRSNLFHQQRPQINPNILGPNPFCKNSRHKPTNQPHLEFSKLKDHWPIKNPFIRYLFMLALQHFLLAIRSNLRAIAFMVRFFGSGLLFFWEE